MLGRNYASYAIFQCFYVIFKNVCVACSNMGGENKLAGTKNYS